MKTIILAAVLAVAASAAQAASSSPSAAQSGWQRVDCATVSASTGLAGAGGSQIAARPGCYVRVQRVCVTYHFKRRCRTVRRETCYHEAQSRLEPQPSAIARARA